MDIHASSLNEPGDIARTGVEAWALRVGNHRWIDVTREGEDAGSPRLLFGDDELAVEAGIREDENRIRKPSTRMSTIGIPCW